jgi:hypothetical protein
VGLLGVFIPKAPPARPDDQLSRQLILNKLHIRPKLAAVMAARMSSYAGSTQVLRAASRPRDEVPRADTQARMMMTPHAAN